MKIKDILTIGSVAMGTAALTVVTFWSHPINAGLESEGPITMIPQAKLVCHDIELGVTTENGKAVRDGENPRFTLTAVNKAATSQTAHICISVSKTAPASAISRTIAMPTVIWTKEQMVTLQGNESKTIPFTVWTNLPANQVVSIHLIDKDPDVSVVTGGPSEFAAKSPVPRMSREIVAFSFVTGTNSSSFLSL